MNPLGNAPRELDLAEVLSCSYRDFHARGLDYVCLRRSPVLTCKLYFFEGDCAAAPEVVCPHDHRYHFESRVILGEVENVLYAPSSSPSAERFNRFSYLTPLNPGPSGFTFSTEEGLSVVSMRSYVAGESEASRSWWSWSDQIHTLRVRSNDLVLLLVQHADVIPIGQPTSTWSRGDAPKLDGLYRRFDVDSLRARLRWFQRRTGIDLRVREVA